jgi:hypothetical protein
MENLRKVATPIGIFRHAPQFFGQRIQNCFRLLFSLVVFFEAALFCSISITSLVRINMQSRCESQRQQTHNRTANSLIAFIIDKYKDGHTDIYIPIQYIYIVHYFLIHLFPPLFPPLIYHEFNSRGRTL